MKLKALYEQVVGHWKTFNHPGHVDPKRREKTGKKDLSFRIKGKKKISNPGKKKKKKEPEGGEDKTLALETGAYSLGHGDAHEIGMKSKGKDIRAGSDMDRLHGAPGKVAGGNLRAWQGLNSKGIKLK